MCNRFDRIPACDGRTDRYLSCDGIVRAMYSIFIYFFFSLCLSFFLSFRAYSTSCVHNMSPFILSSGLSPGSREAKVQRAMVCVNYTEPSVARSSCWSLPVGQCGACWIAAARARWWSSRVELRAIWPKRRRRLLVTRWESGEQPVVPLTSAFDMWRVYGILTILRSAHLSNASRWESRYFVVAQVSHPYIKTGTMYVW